MTLGKNKRSNHFFPNLNGISQSVETKQVDRIARLSGEAQVDAAKAHISGYLGAGWAVFAEEALLDAAGDEVADALV